MQTIGERLEEARKRKGVSIREAAEATKIRGDYLQKFESNQFDLGLADLYVRGFLRSYALFLKLPAEKIITDFNALTAGSSSARRAPSREVYGRMDLSVASADNPDAGAPADGAPGTGEPEGATARRAPSSFTRGGGTIQQGPAISPDLIVKIVLGVVGIVVLLLVIWGIKSVVGGKAGGGTAAPSAQSTPAAAAQMAIFVATGPISLTVSVPKSIDPASPDYLVPGAVPLFNGQLATGQRQSVPYHSDLLVTASAMELLNVEFGGGVVSMREKGQVGYKSVLIPAPAR